VRQQLLEWARQSRQVGVGDAFAEQVRSFAEKLTTEPLVWGEARYTLRGRNILILQGAVQLLNVTYGVDEPTRSVFIMAFRLMPGTPLSEA
jgi:hypothetical protein